jgi:hypothetical protein
MDSTLLYVMMIVSAMLMGVLPFGVFMGLGTATGIASTDPRILITFFLAAAVLAFLINLGANAAVQRSNCGSVKNWNQILNNSAIAFGIQSVTLLLVWLIPALRGVVSGLFPPDTDPVILDSISYSYFSAWAALFGTAISTTLSGICN